METYRVPSIVRAALVGALFLASQLNAQVAPASAAVAVMAPPAAGSEAVSAAAASLQSPVAPGPGITSQVMPGPSPARFVSNDPDWGDVIIDTSSPRGKFPARLVNLSVSAAAGTAAAPLIAGVGVRGEGTLTTLVRAIGPGLAAFGVRDALATAPQLTIYKGAKVAAETSALAPNAAGLATYAGAFPALASTGATATGDAAIAGRMNPGALTVHCTSSTGSTGLALLELYDVSPGATASSAHFVNFSARGPVPANGGVLVVGFVIAGDGHARLLLRGIGPSLQQFGVPGTLADPRIEVYAGNTRIAGNDNWLGTEIQSAAAASGAFALNQASDAALVLSLPAGAYTLHVRAATPSSGGATPAGTVLAEIYELGAAATFDAASSTNSVGIDVLRRLAGSESGNLIISPYSIESALALAWVGAAGDTRTEMSRVLQLSADASAVQAGFVSLRDALTAVANDSIAIAQSRSRGGAKFDPIDWSVANRVFAQQGYPFRDSYLSLLRDGFDAPMQQVDFARATEAVRTAINSWVSEETRNRINDLIPRGGVTSLTRFALVNALYLKAPWDTPFEALRTAPHAFRTGATTKEVPTMQRTEFLGYAKEDSLTIVTLNYLGAGLQFVIMLPAESDNVDAVAARLTPEHLARWAGLARNPTYVALSLPKFTVSGGTVPLAPALRALGMDTAFDVPAGSANFDAMAPRTPSDYFALSEVFHKTYVAVDEQGTEAAAATAVIGGVTSVPITPPPVEVRVDRPFLFAIQHRASGACLFLGRITDPAAK